MNRLKAYPLFSAVMVICVLVIGAEIWWAANRKAAATRNERVMNQAFSRLQDMTRVRPAPTAEVATALERDRGVADDVVQAMRTELSGTSELAQNIKEAVPPADRADAFFDIARFVEAQRAAARAANIELRADEMFGFSAYANSGPVPDLIPAVHRQRLVAEYLVQAAFAARPVRFDGLERARPVTSAAAGNGPAVVNRAETDYFEINPQVSARRDGFVRTTPMRVRFSGQTSALRNFLNRLATYEVPLLVRSVEVEPAPQLNKKQGAPAPAAADAFGGIFGASTSADVAATPAADVPVPIVSDNYSRFTVTVEYLELQRSDEPTAEEGDQS